MISDLFSRRWVRITTNIILVVFIALVLITCVNLFTQHVIAHSKEPFTPDVYGRVDINENTDLKTIFLQTGIGENTSKKMIEDGRFDEILEAQDLFFANDKVVCSSMIKGLTREERLDNEIIPFYALQPGDILVTLSTHSFGWRHGHAAIVLDETRTVESISMLYNSSIENNYFWQDYSNFAVLRVKNISFEEGKRVADFTEKNLVNRRYSLFSGLGIDKSPDVNSKEFALHCSYLAWYAWKVFNVDLDSDGGRVVTTFDILHSDKVEIVQLYGMDPREFID